MSCDVLLLMCPCPRPSPHQNDYMICFFLFLVVFAPIVCLFGYCSVYLRPVLVPLFKQFFGPLVFAPDHVIFPVFWILTLSVHFVCLVSVSMYFLLVCKFHFCCTPAS